MIPSVDQSRAARTLHEIYTSGRPLAYIRSSEELRIGRLLAALGLPLWTWSLTAGLQTAGAEPIPGTTDPRAALDFLINHPHPAIFHLKDFHEPLRDSPAVRRRLRDVESACFDRQKFTVITSPVRAIPDELDRSLVFVELRPPDEIELAAFLHDAHPTTPPALLSQFARALKGLTLDEARYALRRALALQPTLSPASLPALLEEKRLLVNRSGVIEFLSTPTNVNEIGGLDGLKKWLFERQRLFELRDEVNSEIVPKGVLLMGIPGCGKSLSVKAIASCFGLPLYRMDMNAIFSGRHGKPEVVFAETCRMMEEMAPAVLWFDEIENAVSTQTVGGESGRMFGFFLTWMQEKTRGLFVAATANRIDVLPAELLRKGRFDEVFFVDLPLDEERLDIFRIHLERRGVPADGLDLPQLTQFTAGWSGAEVEQCVVSAITKAKLADRPLHLQDLITTAVSIVSLSRTMKEQISHIRAWAFERAVRASPPASRASKPMI
ncbi:MAG: AAA family ATPase [Acidobacteriaceae bacterium]|nr:AAA family ATPase [Acidobacteriaceae bacterium]